MAHLTNLKNANKTLFFNKFQGAGNDFIMVDNRNNEHDHHNPAFIARLCDRRFGIGGDGIMFLENKAGYDFEMVYYNSDGQPSSMCGNGGRCIVAFARKLAIIKEETNFLAVDGPHYAKISEETDWVSLQMIDVDHISQDNHAYILNTGSPHYVLPSKALKTLDVFSEGRAIRNSALYADKGINVNFVEDMGDHYFVRTYERGVEDETYACGTGVTAVAMAMAKEKNQKGLVKTDLKVMGGDLNVRFHYDGQEFTDVFLEGPATFVYEGNISY